MRLARVACFLVATSCSSSSTTQTIDAPLAIDAHPTFDAPPPIDARIIIDDVLPIFDAPQTFDVTPAVDSPPGPDAPPQTFTLSITNYIDWCTITEEGVAFSATKAFPAGTVVHLHGDTKDAGLFVWGYWTGTDPGGHDTMMTTTVTMTTNKSVLACCPVIGQSQTCP
jgi:hypothetical protein